MKGNFFFEFVRLFSVFNLTMMAKAAKTLGMSSFGVFALRTCDSLLLC